MKSLYTFLTLLLICSFSFSTLVAEEIKGQLDLNVDSSFLKEGDLVRGKISIWPIENANLDEFRKLKMKTLMGSLLLVEIESLETSENNADVVELTGLFVLKGTKFQKQFAIEYLGNQIVISSNAYQVEELKGKKSEFEIVDQEVLSQRNILKWILLLLPIVLLIIFWKKIKIITSILQKREEKKKRQYFNDIFMNAKERSDYEKIYGVKKEWLSILKERTPAHDAFLNIMLTHQYKKEWGSEELEDVKTAFAPIQGSFKS